MAIETLKKGATDYVLKDRLIRLVPAVRRALREAEDRTARKRAEAALRKAHDELETKVKERTAELSKANVILKDEISERKRSEAALRESEERFRKIFEEGPLGMAIVVQDFRFVKVNHTLCQMLGYSEQELTSLTFPDITHPEHVDEDVRNAKKLWNGKIPNYKTEKRFIKKDGESLWVTLTATVIRDENKNPLYYLSMLEDIAERKKAEEALKESEERTRTIVNTAVDGIITIDEHGLIESFNSAAERIFGYMADEIIGQNLKVLMPEPYHSEHDQYLTNYLKTGIKKIIGMGREVFGRTKDGTAFPMSLAVSEMRIGHQRMFTGIVRDITERKQAEEALRESEELYRDLYDNAPIGYDTVGVDGRIRKTNRRTAELLGYDRNDLIGRSVLDLYSDTPEGKGKARQLFQKFIAGKEIKSEELEMQKADGSSVWIRLIVRPIRDAQGQVVESRSIVEDITERKQAEQALRESEERLGRILESAMDAIITINKIQHIVLFNEAAEKVFRCSAAEAANKPIDRFLSESFRNLLTNYLQDFGKRKKLKSYMWSPEGLTAIRADGEEFPIEATISQVEVAGEKLFTIILRDINERQKAEAELNKLQIQNIYLQEEIKSEYNFGEIIGASEIMKKVFKNIEKVAGTDSTVLLTGETGTGKELIARAIHNSSSRKDSVLINVNCGALPAGLVESELFGHEKGAFTGATAQRKGRFELADGGTIFLDEVGELPVETQLRLLRVLQEQEFERVGGTQTKKVNVRVIAATNRNLEEAVNNGAFRADLFYRLNIFPIHIPALRERIDDTPLLTNYFIKKFSRRLGKRIDSLSPKAMEKLLSYEWPGNVRELANILERAAILCDSGVLKPEHIGISIQRAVPEMAISTLEHAERQHILRALEETSRVLGGPKGAAKLLGINRSTLWSRMKKLGVE